MRSLHAAIVPPNSLVTGEGLLPVGYALVGVAADHLGPALVFVLGGILSALIIALGLLHPAVRAVD